MQIVRFALVFALLIGVASIGEAQERSSLLPDVPKATGEPHPEGNEFWRKNHANLLAHDRDLTVRDGDRNIRASLKSCIACHATAVDDQGTVLTADSPSYFCSVCHQYVAVKITCFVCHRSTPDGVDEYKAQAALLPNEPLGEADMQGILAYLNKPAPDKTNLAEVGE
jgi:[DsrC]-trisulfide reductase subunit J